jgi:predicted AlkP superfamily phosphohydrolase/phosphomutase
MEEGTYGSLLSVPNMNSAPAWSTFATGKGPAEHGIFYFSRIKPGHYEIEPINASYRHGETFWSIASEHGKSVVVINVPITYPAEPVNGYLIAGLDAPGVGSVGFTYPTGLSDELQHNVGEYEIEVGMPSLIKAGKLDEAIARAKWTVERRKAAAEYLMDRPWDLFIVVFTSTDVMQHFFWKYMQAGGDSPLVAKYRHAIRDFYRFVDEQVGALLSRLGDDVSVMVMSDHGSGALCEATKILPDWLSQNGFLSLREPQQRNPLTRAALGAFRALYRFVDTHLTRNQKLALARLFPRLRVQVESTILLGNIDWSRTRVYAAESRNELRVNLKGREPLGIVSPGSEYEEVRQQVISSLQDWRSPSGEKYVRQVFRREEVYRGRFFERAPDILIHWNPTGGELDRSAVDLFNYQVNGDHLPNGVLIASGEPFKRRARISGARLIDVAPTILHVLDVPVPSDMEGRVLQGLLASEHMQEVSYAERTQEHRPSAVQYTQEEREQIEDRLRGLGYID